LEASRYQTKQSFVATSLSINKPEEVKPMMEGLRKLFATDHTTTREWRMNQLLALKRLLSEGGDLLRAAMKKDLGKSGFESNISEIDLTMSEVVYAISHLDTWMAKQPRAISPLNQPGAGYTVADPLGVVLIMSAWNYPVLLALSPLVGALAAGNCVVVKPAPYAPHTSHALTELLCKYMDNKAIKVVEGDRHVTDALLKERFDTIFFTGSGFVGKIVAKAAAEHLCPVVLELGGKSPCIVDETADLELSASRLIWGAFFNSGQTCVRPDHCLVHESIGDAFVKVCERKIKEFYSDNVQKTEWFGRIINDGAFDRLSKLIDASKADPNCKVYGGVYDKTERFVHPTLLDYGKNAEAFYKSPAMQDEIFGPLIPIRRYRTLDEAIQHSRNLPTGKPLALYFFSSSKSNVAEVTAKTTSGGMCVNDCLMHLANHELGFGGVGQSGMGAYHGLKSFQCFSHEKSVLEKSSAIDSLPVVRDLLAVRFPPYLPWKQQAVKALSNESVVKFMEFLETPTFKNLSLLLLGALLFRKLGFTVSRL